MADHDYYVLRFWNNDALGNIDGVVENIRSTLIDLVGQAESS
jgi:very-short-patch-repair endonuclease